jgi:hypothetical protein
MYQIVIRMDLSTCSIFLLYQVVKVYHSDILQITIYMHVTSINISVILLGGVGKSTVALNLACTLSKSGLNVGLLDLDIYGPR